MSMNEESPMNIFSAAAKKKKSRSSTKSGKEPAPQEKPPVAPASRHTVLRYDGEIDEMLQRIHEMKDDLDAKMELLVNYSGITKERLHHLINTNAKHLAQEQVDFLNNQPKKLAEELWAIVGSQSLGGLPQKNEADRSKVFKAKMMGSRRNWMPLR